MKEIITTIIVLLLTYMFLIESVGFIPVPVDKLIEYHEQINSLAEENIKLREQLIEIQ